MQFQFFSHPYSSVRNEHGIDKDPYSSARNEHGIDRHLC